MAGLSRSEELLKAQEKKQGSVGIYAGQAKRAAERLRAKQEQEAKKKVDVDVKSKVPTDLGVKGGTGETWEERKARMRSEIGI